MRLAGLIRLLIVRPALVGARPAVTVGVGRVAPVAVLLPAAPEAV